MRRLLLVDDSRAARDALRVALEPYGFELEEAEDGAQALKLLAGSAFDLAFVDLTMPVLDGPSLVRMARARGLATPIVLVTAGAETATVVATIKSGVAGYVTKPFRAAELHALTGRILGLDPATWVVRPVDLVVLHADPAAASELRALLPERVRVSEADTLARTLALCEARAPAVVLLDAGTLEGDPISAAALVRQVVPDAGVFALRAGAGEERACVPEEALDGLLPRPVPAVVARELLGAYLRPLVFAEGATLRAAGFAGAPRFHPGYAAALARALGAQGEEEDPAQDLAIDLSRVPLGEADLAAVVRAVRERLDARGLAPAFHVPAPLVAPLKARPELARAVVLGPP